MNTKTDDETKVLEDSPEAAKMETVTGWVSRDGFFYGDKPDAERIARFAGCTHRICDGCGAEYKKSGYCRPCNTKNRTTTYWKMSFKEWDGDAPLVIFDTDHYFFDESSLRDHCMEHDIPLGEVKLVICDPVRLNEYDINDAHCDELLDGCQVEDAAVLDAVDVLNEAIKNSSPIGWEQGRFRTAVE